MTPDLKIAAQDAAARIDHLTADGLRDARRLLTEAQQHIIARLANAPTDYEVWFYNELLRDSQQLFTRIEHDLKTQIETGMQAVIDATDTTVTQAVSETLGGGPTLTIAMPRMNRAGLELLTGYKPGALISNVAQDTKRRITTILQQGLLGGQSPWDVQKQIGARIDQGIFASSMHRAEVIWHTEANRFYNILAQQRYHVLQAKLPGEFEKVWVHNSITNPRPHHLALDGQAIPINDHFLVAGYEVEGPHDPILPAKEVINCRCSLYVRPT